MKEPRKHQPHWKDSTITARSKKRTTKDNEWAAQISGGRYPTLRKLMTAIHKGEFVLQADTLITKGTSTLEIRGEQPITFKAVAFKKGPQSPTGTIHGKAFTISIPDGTITEKKDKQS
jgi:hypothetical protein